jgi:hypothetical protein
MWAAGLQVMLPKFCRQFAAQMAAAVVLPQATYISPADLAVKIGALLVRLRWDCCGLLQYPCQVWCCSSESLVKTGWHAVGDEIWLQHHAGHLQGLSNMKSLQGKQVEQQQPPGLLLLLLLLVIVVVGRSKGLLVPLIMGSLLGGSLCVDMFCRWCCLTCA